MRFTETSSYSTYQNGSRTVGLLPVEKPHNEKPVGIYSTHLLSEWVELFERMDEEEVYLYEVPHPDCDNSALAATRTEDAEMAYSISPRVKR